MRQSQQRVCRAIAAAATARQREQQQFKRTGSRQGTAAATAQAERRAEAAVAAGIAVEDAWATSSDALRLFTPSGEWNTRARAAGLMATAVPTLAGAAWDQTRRALTRPQVLTFLDQVERQLAAVPVAADLRAAAVRVAGLRQRPEGLRGEGPAAAAWRGVLLAAGLVLTLSGSAGSAAVKQVGEVWR